MIIFGPLSANPTRVIPNGYTAGNRDPEDRQMAMTAADMAERFSRMTTIDVDRAPTILPFLDRSWEAELLNAEVTTIQNWNLASAEATLATLSRTTAKAAWQTAKEMARTQILFRWTQQAQQGVDIPYLDVVQSPVGDLEKVRAALAAALARQIEDNVVAYLNGLTAYTTAKPAAGDLPKEDGTGSNGNAGKIYSKTYGDATNYIGTDGAPKGTGDTLVKEALRDASVRFQRSDVLTGVGVGTRAPSGLVSFIQPELLRVMADELEDDATGAWAPPERAAAEGPAILRGERYGGTYRGIQLISCNGLAAPTAKGTWPFYIFTREAVAYARSMTILQNLTPQTNQDKPVYNQKVLMFFGRQLINSHLIMKPQIKTQP